MPVVSYMKARSIIKFILHQSRDHIMCKRYETEMVWIPGKEFIMGTDEGLVW